MIRLLSVGFTVSLIIVVVALKLKQSRQTYVNTADKSMLVEQMLNVNLARPLYEYYRAHKAFPKSHKAFLAEINKMRAEYSYQPLTEVLDPWERPIQYIIPGKINTGAYDLHSLGPDGVASGDDIANYFVADKWPPTVGKH